MAKMLKAQEAADYLGVHIETIRRLARSGKIPAMKIGRGWRIREGELILWAKTHFLRSNNVHVLVVDDEEEIHASIRSMLIDEIYRISSVTEGKKAIELINSDPPDIVLLDLVMPGMNGVDTLSKIRKLDESLPVIIITEYPDSELIKQAAQYAPIMLLPKPVEFALLERTVRTVLGERMSMRVGMTNNTLDQN